MRTCPQKPPKLKSKENKDKTKRTTRQQTLQELWDSYRACDTRIMGALGEESQPVGLRACPENEVCPGLPALTRTFPANPTHSTGPMALPTADLLPGESSEQRSVPRKEQYLSGFREDSGDPLRAKQERKEFLAQEPPVPKPLRVRVQSGDTRRWCNSGVCEAFSGWEMQLGREAGQDYTEL